MSGIEIVGLLLGVSGPVEQGILTIQRLRNHYRNFKQNLTTIDNLHQLLQQNRTKLQRLNLQITKCKSHLSQHATETMNDTIFKVNQDINNAYKSLKQLEITVTSKAKEHVLKASNVAADCINIQQLLEKTDNSLVQLISFITVIESTISVVDAQTDKRQKPIKQQSSGMNQTGCQASSSHATADNFIPRIQLQPHTRSAIPNFNQTDQHSNPITIEGKIKLRLLTPSNKPVNTGNKILSILGEAGVGKTTLLNMLCHEADIQSYFEDGIYYMSLGADVSTDSVFLQLREIVRTTGGVKLAGDATNWTSISHAIEKTSEWLQDKTFLMLIDDVWDTITIGNHLQDILTQIVLPSPDASVVFTTRNPEVAIHGEVFKLRRKEPQSQESRSMLMRHAGYSDDSIFDDKSEGAIANILQKTAGLAVAHSVAGRAIRAYDVSSDNGMSPWVWYVGMNKSIIKSAGDRYSSLDVIFSIAIRTLEVSDTKSSSSELRKLTTEDYKRMHRSLCVFEKKQWILIPVLVRLWGLEQSSVRSICEEFIKVGLAERHDNQFEDATTIEGIMVHDLLHDFATEEAKKHETVEKWHEHILTEYSKEDRVDENEKFYSWWKVKGSVENWYDQFAREDSKEPTIDESEICCSWWKLKHVDHGYLMKNLFRHLLRSECTDRDMNYLVSRPQWIQSQLITNGIIQYEKDVLLAIKQNENKKDLHDQSIVSNKFVGKVLDAARLSASYICDNPGEVWFQLYARLMSAENLPCLTGYLQYIEEKAPRPWLKPVSGCLTGVEDEAQQLINVNGLILCTTAVPHKDEIICGCADGSIAVIDIEESRVKREWKVYKVGVTAICVSPSGRFIVSGYGDGTVKLWDCENRKQLGTVMSGHTDWVSAVAVSRDERTLYTGSRDGSVRSWDIDTCAQKTALLRSVIERNCLDLRLQVLPDENLIVAYESDSLDEVMKISFSTQKENKRKERLKLILRKAGRHLACLGRLSDGKESVHEAEFECPFEIIPVEKNVRLAGFSADGIRFVTQDENYDLKIWNGITMNMVKIGNIPRSGSRVWRTALDNKSKSIATLDVDGTVTVYKEVEGSPEGTYQTVGMWNSQLDTFQINEMHFMGFGEKIVLCIISGSIRVFSLGKKTNKQVRETQKISVVEAVAATPSGEFFCTGHQNGQIGLWETRTRELSSTFGGAHETRVVEVTISENGKWLVSRSRDGTVAVWNMQSRYPICWFEINDLSVCDRGLDVSCDGTRVVLQTEDGMIQLWDTVKTEEPLLVIPKEKRTSGTSWHEVWFNKGSLYIVTVSDESIEEWDTSNGSCTLSRKFNQFYLHFSKQRIFNMLNNPESQDVNEPHRLYSLGNVIFYGKQNFCKKLATFELRIYSDVYSLKSQKLCVSNGGNLNIFDVYTQ